MNLKPLLVFPTESVDVWKVRVLPVKVTTLEDPVCCPSERIIALLEPSERWEAKKVMKIKLFFALMFNPFKTYQKYLNDDMCFCRSLKSM